MIEYVGKTAQIVVRKDLNITKVEQLKGLKVANQTGSSVGNIFVDIIAQNAGLKKGDFQEVRMNVNNMVAAMAAKTVDAMVNVEPYNAIAVAEGIGTSIMDFSSVDRMPVFMAATPDFVDKNADTVVAYLKCWQDVATRLQGQPEQGRGRDLCVLHLEGLQHVARYLRQGARPRRGQPGLPAPTCSPSCRSDAEVLLREKKISAIPDWKKALRPDLWAEGQRVAVLRAPPWRFEGTAAPRRPLSRIARRKTGVNALSRGRDREGAGNKNSRKCTPSPTAAPRKRESGVHRHCRAFMRNASTAFSLPGETR